MAVVPADEVPVVDGLIDVVQESPTLSHSLSHIQRSTTVTDSSHFRLVLAGVLLLIFLLLGRRLGVLSPASPVSAPLRCHRAGANAASLCRIISLRGK